MRRLICSAEVRLGQNGIEDFKVIVVLYDMVHFLYSFFFFSKNHPWFSSVDWSNITWQQAPYIPEVSSPTDTSNFDVDDNDLRQCDTQPPQHNAAFSGLHLPFAGFSFTMDSQLSDLGKMETSGKLIGETEGSPAKATRPLSSSSTSGASEAMDGLSKNAYERRISRLEDEKKELVRKVADTNRALQKFAHGPLASGATAGDGDSNRQESAAAEVRKLQDELNKLTKKNNGELIKGIIAWSVLQTS